MAYRQNIYNLVSSAFCILRSYLRTVSHPCVIVVEYQPFDTNGKQNDFSDKVFKFLGS